MDRQQWHESGRLMEIVSGCATIYAIVLHALGYLKRMTDLLWL